MRTGAVVIAIALLPWALPAAAQAATVSVSPSAGDLATVFHLVHPATFVAAPEALADPDLASPSAPWRADDRQILGSATIAFGDGGAHVQVASARSPGDAWIEQTFPVDAGAYDLAIRQRGSGTFLGLAFVIREGDRETRFDAQPTSATSTLRFPWHPHADTTQATLFVRLSFGGGDSADVHVERASLTPTTDVAWSFDDGTPVEHGLATDHRFATPGHHAISATLRQPGGAPSTSTAEVDVGNAAPHANLTARRVGTTGLFALDATASFDPDGFETRVRDPTFAKGAEGWALEASEIGAPASMTATSGLRLASSPASREGSLFAWQSVPIVPARPYRFEVTARDDGAIARYELILREDGSAKGRADHVLSHDPVGSNATRLGLTIVPKYDDSTRLVVHLRVVLHAGAAADVTFSNVSLRESLAYSWTLDGTALPDAQPVARVPLLAGEHEVAVTVRDAVGATDRAVLAVNGTFPDGSPVAAIHAPAFALRGQGAVFTAAPSRAAPGSQLLDADAHAPIVPGGVYELRLRATGPGALSVVLREQRRDGEGLRTDVAKRIERFDLEPGGNDLRVRYQAVDDAITDLTIETTGAPTSDLSLSEALDAHWSFNASVAGQTEFAGYAVSYTPAASGSLLATLTVVDAGSRSNATSVLVPVLDPSTLAIGPRLGGGVHLSWPGIPIVPEFRAFEIERAGRDWTQPIATTLAFDDAPPPGAQSYRVSIALANGTRALAAIANVTIGSDAPLGAIAAPSEVPRGGIAPLSVVAPEDARAVEARILWGPLVVGHVALRQNATGAWTGDWRVGVTPPGSVRVEASATRADGAVVPLGAFAVVRVGALDGPTPLVALFVALGLVAAAWGVRRSRRG